MPNFFMALSRRFARRLLRAWVRRDSRSPSSWEEFPYSFGVDWYSPYGDYHQRPVCSCYYCRRVRASQGILPVDGFDFVA